MMQQLTLDDAADQPLYWQLYWQLRQRILAGDLPPGAKLPPSRRLAEECGVARATVIHAFAQLQAEGYVESRTGAGTFVVDSLPLRRGRATAVPCRPDLSHWGQRVQATAVPVATPVSGRGQLEGEPETAAAAPEIDFGFGRSFSHIFPYDVWRQLLARYLSTDDIILARYGSVAGFTPLRQALAAHLAAERGVRCTPGQVVIVSGAPQTLDILCRLFLKRGDSVLVETPGYADAYNLFRANGAHLTAIPVDAAGLPAAQIPPGVSARFLFVTPSNQFPRGGTMPVARRLALLAWAREQNALIIEDDYDGELRYDGHPLTALQGLDEDGRVIYLGAFSKVLFPALRLGYVVLPPHLVEPFVQAKRLVDRGAPTLTQAAVADFIQEGHFARHLRHLRQVYGERRALLVDALRRHLGEKGQFSTEPAGLHVMVYLKLSCREAEVVQRAAAAGVRVYPGAPYHFQQPAPPSILLGFSGAPEDLIEEGVRRLTAVLANMDAC
jgi:GntR family transcriptional regulator/MocR family aminotransferase